MMTTHARHSRTPVRPAEELPLPRGGLRLNAGGFSGLLIAAALLLSPSTGRALPSFARQLNMQCIMCHTEYPVLNQFGRQFKLTGYTLAAVSYTHLRAHETVL